MKHTITDFLTALAATALLGAGCGAETPVGSAGSPDAYQIRPAGVSGNQPIAVALPGSPVVAAPGAQDAHPEWLVRTANHEHSIESIAVTDGYVYFEAWWEGIYRVPKAGGAIEVIDAATRAEFKPITTAGNQVFWVKSTFDDRDYPHVQLKRRPDGGGPNQVLFDDDWGITSSSPELSNFQADASGVYMIAGRAGAFAYDLFHVPPDGGAIGNVLPLEPSLSWPSWLIDDARLFFVPRYGVNKSPIRAIAKSGGTDSLIATVPASEATLYALDADSLYLLSQNDIWRAAKDGSNVSAVVHFEGANHPGSHLLVDDSNLYFINTTADATELRAVPKAGGTPTTIASGMLFAQSIQIEQDATQFYVLGPGGQEISLVSKTPTQ